MQEADRGIMLHFKQKLALMPKIIDFGTSE
jgi:hypothetical protein